MLVLYATWFQINLITLSTLALKKKRRNLPLKATTQFTPINLFYISYLNIEKQKHNIIVQLRGQDGKSRQTKRRYIKMISTSLAFYQKKKKSTSLARWCVWLHNIALVENEMTNIDFGERQRRIDISFKL